MNQDQQLVHLMQLPEYDHNMSQNTSKQHNPLTQTPPNENDGGYIVQTSINFNSNNSNYNVVNSLTPVLTNNYNSVQPVSQMQQIYSSDYNYQTNPVTTQNFTNSTHGISDYKPLNNQGQKQIPISQLTGNSQTFNKSELLKWLSYELNIQVNNIQRISSGTLLVLLIVKVLQQIQKQANLKAKAEVESLTNFKLIFKILQEQGQITGVNWIGNMHNKPSQQNEFMNKLIKGKVNEIIEMVQMIKRFYDNFKTVGLNPHTQLHCQKLVQLLFDESSVLGIDQTKKSHLQDATNKSVNQPFHSKSILSQDYNSATSNIQNQNPLQTQSNNVLQFEKLMSKSYLVSQDLDQMISENQELRKMNIVQQVKTKCAEKERDFYFGKLRDIELLLFGNGSNAQRPRGQSDISDQQNNSNNVQLNLNQIDPEEKMRAIVKILYAKEDENIEVDEDGNIIV